MAPVLFKWLPILDKPIHEKKLGAHKTWRGIIVATLVGTLIFAIQKWIYSLGLTSWSLIDYSGYSFLFGTMIGFGAIAGDAIESYYKRKQGIAPGQSWLPWDQLDFVIGGLIAGLLFYVPPAEVVLVLVVVSPLLHLSVKYIGYLLKLEKKKI
jgi:CDP-2,3-bis-(O-geranylgeranyl)-sn-glycerol synthase